MLPPGQWLGNRLARLDLACTGLGSETQYPRASNQPFPVGACPLGLTPQGPVLQALPLGPGTPNVLFPL